MAYRVLYSSLAKNSFEQNITYLEKEWTIKEIRNFIDKTSEVVELLKMDPYVFPLSEFDPNIRKVVLIKQITLFFEIVKKEVHIHLFWNNYQDPERIKRLLGE